MTEKVKAEIEPKTAALAAELLAHCLSRRPPGFRPDVSVPEYAARIETALEALKDLARGEATEVVIASVGG